MLDSDGTTDAVPARLTGLSRSIAGRCAIVTGGASGMGRATAHLFADEGARVVVADISAERVETVVSEIAAVHGLDAALGVVCDVADRRSLAHLVQSAVAWSGGIDIVVNNAGVVRANDPFQEEDDFETAWASTIEINLSAQARLIRLALPHLMKSTSARVVNIASTEALVASVGTTSYAASKAGVVGLTRALAVELGRHGITVNCICPGPIQTAMTSQYDDDTKSTYARRRVALRRYGEAEEVAHMTLSLVLPAASFVTGAALPVDGGVTIRHT